MNVAMISGWHVHAKSYAEEVSKIDGCCITAVWDEEEKRGKEWAAELKCSFVASYDEIIADSNIDAVMINSPTKMHTELMLKAAEAGKHIFTEKILSLTVKEAKQIQQALEKSKSVFSISFPHRCKSELLLAKQLSDSGKLGTITYARVRNVHDGSIRDWLPEHFYNKEQCGGGAMVDLGAHPVYLLTWLLGLPESVSATFTNVTPRGVEDNAVGVLEYKNGCIAVAETGFVSRFAPFALELNGTKGSLLVGWDSLRYANEDTDGKWIDAKELPGKLPSPIEQWVSAINSGNKPLFAIEDAMALTVVMEAFYQSHEQGCKVKIC